MAKTKEQEDPIYVLIKEHRVIGRMIGLINKEIKRIEKEKTVRTVPIDSIADFFREYADRCHHGKEEDVLFRRLEEKKLSEEHRKVMDGLISDHVDARNIIRKLSESNSRYSSGDKASMADVVEQLKHILGLYPPHIDIEDNHFFIPAMGYFSDEEKKKMADDFRDFDSRRDKKHYEEMVDEMKKEHITAS